MDKIDKLFYFGLGACIGAVAHAVISVTITLILLGGF